MVVGLHSLPAELRSHIVRYVTEAAQQTPRNHHLSILAVVCKQWQVCVERVNFASLKLVATDLSDFNRLVDGRRRAWLRRIWLEVKLPEYDRQMNDVLETDEEQLANNIRFTTDIQSLFELLARWPIDDCLAGLEFELSVRSPSDPRELVGKLGSRYFESHNNFAFLDTQWLGLHGLPIVDVITKFAVLRRCRRDIDSDAILIIVLSLPRITELWYEPHQFDANEEYLLMSMPPRLLPQST
jgi:hypothetical protein